MPYLQDRGGDCIPALCLTCACRTGEVTATSAGCPSRTGSSTTATSDTRPFSCHPSTPRRAVTCPVGVEGAWWLQGRSKTRGTGGWLGLASSRRASRSRLASHLVCWAQDRQTVMSGHRADIHAHIHHPYPPPNSPPPPP